MKLFDRDKEVLYLAQRGKVAEQRKFAEDIKRAFVAKLDEMKGSNLPVAAFFDRENVSYLTVELFSDILFYGFHFVLRYEPFNGYKNLDVIADALLAVTPDTISLDFYRLLFREGIIQKAISSQVALRSVVFSPTYTVTARITFAACHYLPYYEGLCRNLHGHEWAVEVQYSSRELNNMGMVVDFGDIKGRLRKRVEERFDHAFINDTITNPTAENICNWIYNHMHDGDETLSLVSVTVFETPHNKAVVR